MHRGNAGLHASGSRFRWNDTLIFGFPFLRIVPRALERVARAFFARGMRRHDDEQQSFLPGEKIVETQNAFALGGAKLAEAQKTAQPSVRRAIGRIGENVGRAVDEDESRADEQFRRRAVFLQHFLYAFIGAHHARKRVAVGDADRGMAVKRRRQDQFSGMRSATQKREIRGDRDLGVGKRGTHAKSPCMNQRGAAVSLP